MKLNGKKMRYAITVCMMLLLMLLCSVTASAKTYNRTVKAKKGSDITSVLQKELNRAAGKKGNVYNITISPGSYKINGTLKIYSNTNLYMDGVTLKRVKKGTVMLRLGGNSSYKGYKQAKNITVNGGTWDGAGKTGDLMRFGHGQNIAFNNVTLTNVREAHHIEIAACRDVVFSGCTFSDYKGKKKSNHVEALQIDIMRKEHFNYYPAYDETPCVNVTVTGCAFRNLQSGAGTHSAVLGSYHKNIQIVNNTFEKIHGYAVIGMNYVDSKINNNVMENCGFGIEFRSLSTTQSSVYTPKKGKVKPVTNVNSEIIGNKMTIVQTGYKYRISAIKLYGKKLSKKSGKIPAGNYRISGMTIQDNEIVQKCKGVAVILEGVDNSTVVNNTVTCEFAGAGYNMGEDGGSAIRLDSCSQNTVGGNTVVNIAASNGGKMSGICVYKSSSDNTVEGNRVENAGQDGIVIKSSDNIVLNRNTVTGSGRYGVFAANASTVRASGNQVSGSGKYDVNVWGATVNGAKDASLFG